MWLLRRLRFGNGHLLWRCLLNRRFGLLMRISNGSNGAPKRISNGSLSLPVRRCHYQLLQAPRTSEVQQGIARPELADLALKRLDLVN